MWAAGLGLAVAPLTPLGQPQLPVVQAILFYSPTCPHCHQVITEDLPPMMDRFGGQVQIIAVDTSSEAGYGLYQAAIERFSIPEERRGVPMLIVGDVVLVGSIEIPERFPALIEQYLASGGVGWPEIPGLADAMAAAQAASGESQTESTNPAPSAGASSAAAPGPAPTAAALSTTGALPGYSGIDDSPDSVRGRLARDPLGSAIAVAVLIFMLFTVAAVTRDLIRRVSRPTPAWHETMIPVLCLAGFAVAGYLAYVEAARVEAVCGPIGDCNAVQQSEYARLFGVIPIGALGLAGYTALGATWLVRRSVHGRAAQQANGVLFAMALIGVLFSIYLTFLEPFVIGANCAWCLTSAVIMALLLRLMPARVRLGPQSSS
jgi:uncharacterized membrane protein